MKRLTQILIALLLATLFSTSLSANKIRGEYATKNLEGQNYYISRCSKCHGEGSRGGNMASIREWKELFSKNGLELKELHEDDEETIEVVKYFNSNDFKKESKLMLQLLQEFAYDSDNIPTCN